MSRRLYDRIWMYAHKAIEYSVNSCDDIACGLSVYDFCIEQIKADDEFDDDQKYLAAELLEWLTTFTAVDVRKQSLRYYHVEATFPVTLISWLFVDDRVKVLL